jgi:fibronectin-binding autotransporter adhesin
MSARGNILPIVRGKSATRRSTFAMCGAAALSLMAISAHAQTSYTWTSPTSGNWSNGAKWSGGTAPVVASSGDVNLEFNAAGTYTSNNDLGPFGVFNMTFDADNGTANLTGGEIDLSNPPSEPNNPFFTNSSTHPVTINNNTVFVATNAQGDGTLEQFVMAPGSTTTFNGTMTLDGGAGMQMTNGQSSGTGGPGGTMIWTQPVTFTNSNTATLSNYFPFRIYEGTLEMGGYTIDNGTSDAPVINIAGINVLQQNAGVNNGAQTDMYIGPEDYEDGHPNDVASFYLIAGGNSFNQPIQVGDAGTITIGGVNTSGTVTFNDFFKTLPTDGNGVINGVSQTIYYSAAAGGTVLQNFQLIRGGGGGSCGASIDKIGAGTWIVAGGGDNDSGEQAYTGTTTVRDGTLELAYDDTGTNFVTLPQAAITAGAPYYSSGDDGGSLGYNAPTNPVQLGDSGTLPTDNIALLTLSNSGAPGPRQVLHYINVNNNNPSGTTTIGVGDNGTANFQGNILLNKTVVLTSGTGGVANFGGNITGAGGITIAGTGVVNLSGINSYQGITNVTDGTLALANVSSTMATTLFHELQTGYHAGAWNGTSPTNAVIVSSTSAAHRITTLGYKYNATASTFTITYTLPGDTNLDGLVNGTDLSAMAAVGTTNATWSMGDFNYDSIVNADDYSLLMFGAAYGHVPAALVPEPAVAGLLSLPLIASLKRKRRAN